MGIRYYAYAFDAEMTELAMVEPGRFLGDDPLADAWGMTRGAPVGFATFVQSVPATDMLYLDKAWFSLQALCRPSHPERTPRPAHRMFEGQVTFTDDGWTRWVRGLAPDEVVEIADDLVCLQRAVTGAGLPGRDAEYVAAFLQRAVTFVTHAASSRRGFVYMIG